MSHVSVNTALVRSESPSVQRVMLQVLVALLPGIVALYWLTGPGVLLNVVFACFFAVILECMVLVVRKKSLHGEGTDLSIVVAASLLALSVPPTLPFMHLLFGVLVLVLLGKHVFGGLGQNPFNPAMVAYAALFISFPQSMTLWFNPTELTSVSLLDTLKFKTEVVGQTLSHYPAWDAITKATPLEHLRTLKLNQETISVELANHTVSQAPWIIVSACFFIGGVYLLWRKVIQWQIPVTVIASFAIVSLVWATFGTNSIPNIGYSLFSGALIFGAFFIATDPVTAASSTAGRIVYGTGIGLLAFIIRYFGGYPDGFAFAVLLMNLCVPTIDYAVLKLSQP